MTDERSTIAANPSAVAIKYQYREGRSGPRPRGKFEDARECAVVEMDSVTLAGVLPGVTVADENSAVASGGTPVAENVTASVNAPFEGATESANIAGCPATTVAGAVGPVTE